MSNIPLVTNIQRYGIHDGSGIRTVVFFKGCPLSCKWCHNPETQSFSCQMAFYPERCARCGVCADICPEGLTALGSSGIQSCKACGRCCDVCAYGAREIVGKEYAVSDLASILYRDIQFYTGSGGGVTLSGGEPLVQDKDYLIELLACLHRRGINTAVDTCGEAPWEVFEAVLPYVNTFLYDFKALDEKLHKDYAGIGNVRILDNLSGLCESAANINLRVPVIVGFNDGVEMDHMIAYAEKKLRVSKVSLLPYHNTGSGKYARIGKKQCDSEFSTPSGDYMEKLADHWRNAGFACIEIGG